MGNFHLAWDGVKSTIETQQRTNSINLGGKLSHELPDDFNSFYTQFDTDDFTSELTDYCGNSVILDTGAPPTVHILNVSLV